MATAIFFNGRRITRPGAYSEIDASELATLGPSPTGIVALIGTAEGGAPLSVAVEDSDHSRSGTVLKRYRSGDLRVAGSFAFQASVDEATPGGAQKLVCVKVNPALQSEVTLDDADGNDSVLITSSDYGLFTAQISIAIAAGTTIGRKITVVFEDKTETFDDVGGTGIYSLQYTAGSNGYGAVTLAVSSTQSLVTATKAVAGLSTDRVNEMSSTQAVEVVSSNAGDTTQILTVYGITALGVPLKETISLNGVTPVEGLSLFAQVTAAKLSASCAGTVTVRTADGITTLFTFLTTVLTKGLSILTNAGFAGVGTIAVDATAANSNVVVRGTTAAGAEVAVRLDSGASLSQSLTTAMASVKNITHIELGDVAAARTITLTTTIGVTHAAYRTVQRQVDRFNAITGLTATSIVSNPTTFDVVDADYEVAASILGTAVTIYADLNALVEKLNNESLYVDAERVTGASKKPAIAAAQFLTGGVEGTTTITQWADALTLLKRRRVNIIVPLTEDAAVHALLADHLVLRAGKLRSEANGYIGIGTADGAGETMSNIKAQIIALSTRHISAISQEVKRYDVDTGDATWFPPYIFAAIAGGMQAAASVGEPMTKKKPFALDIRQDASWTVEDNDEEMIDAGLMFAEKDDTKGIRWVRSITTHLADDNAAFCEMSANTAANYAVYELRRRLELKVGRKGLSGSAAAIKGLAAAVLADMIDDEIIVAWQALLVEQIADAFPVQVQMAPVLPINFIPVTVHLVSVRVAA